MILPVVRYGSPILRQISYDVHEEDLPEQVSKIYKELHRPEKIRVRYQNLSFETMEEELRGLPARIFQHEYDHLEGILFIDRLSALQRKLLSGKLKKIRKQL
ncbi:MAG: peptide deformylase [Mangrovibacterium sp.]|nr:peptide deformylase [Mangrovibacterium sp.]